MGVHAVRAALAEAGNPAVPGRVLRHGVRRRRVGPQGARRARAHRRADRRHRSGLRERRRRAAARGGRDPRRAVRLRARVRRREDAQGHHPLVVLRAVARGRPGSRRRPRTSRCARSACSAKPGSTKEHLAEVVVKNRRNGVHNPNAMFRKEVTADEVLASRVVCEPLHLWMLCSPNEGAAALVLQRGEGGVQLASARLRSHLPGSVLGEATPLSGIDDSDITPPSTLAARDAYAEAGHRSRRPRRRRVPGHRRGPRAARVPGARPLRARRTGASSSPSRASS